jgi:hypothetical protein
MKTIDTMTEQELLSNIKEESTSLGMTQTDTRKNADGTTTTPIAFYTIRPGAIDAVIQLCKLRGSTFIKDMLVARFRNLCKTVATVQVKGESGRSDTRSDEDKLAVFGAFVDRIGLGTVKGLKSKREKAIVRACATVPTRITELSTLFADLADDDGPIQDEQALKAALVSNKVIGDDADLADWLKG